MNVNETIVAGDTLDFTVSVPDYPPSAGWTLKYRLTPRFATPTQAPITLTATTSGTDYLVQAAPATTAAWLPGTYAWARWVEKSGARQTLDESGELLVKADPALTAQGFDGRSQALKAYEDAMTAFATYKATNGQVKEYTIGSRQMKFKDSGEIVKEIEFWRQQVTAEQDAAKLAAGQGNPRTIGIRINRI